MKIEELGNNAARRGNLTIPNKPPVEKISVNNMHDQKRAEDPTFEITERNDSPLGAYDVICGRHKAAFDNIGNRRFRVLVALSQDKYTAAPTRAHKTTFIRSIIDSVHNGGGRFLQRVGCTWVELDAKQTHDKVGHALRDMAIASRIKTKSPARMRQILSIHGKDQSPNVDALPTSVRCMSPTDDISAVCNNMVDGYVVNFSGSELISEDHQYMKEFYRDDHIFRADGLPQCHRTFDCDRHTSEIPQNLLLQCKDRTFVIYEYSKALQE
jgi:hypothetical protein